jgi:hypothetical protein
MLHVNLRERMDALDARITANTLVIGAKPARFKNVEETVVVNGKKLHLTRDRVQQIATAIDMFNNTAPKLDNTLPEVLHDSVMSVNLNIQSLFDQIGRLKDQIRAVDVLGRNAGPVRSESTEFDITAIHPYPSMVAHWREPPDLPPIHQFMNIGEVDDYIYRIVPKLQAHLTAMQSKIVGNAADLLQKVDKSLIEKRFEKFQAVIGEIRGRVDELKNAVEQTATREEINEMLEERLNTLTQEGQTTVGRMKCMACGRDIPQVTGALTEAEANRTLEISPNSIVYKVRGPAKVGVVYQITEGFDSRAPASGRGKGKH